MSTETIIFIGVGVYMALMLGVGVYASRRNKSTTDFIVAGRRMPFFLLSATIIATWFGGGTMMGASGAAYDDGLLGVIVDPFGSTLTFFLIGLFFARFYRRLKLLTFIELVEQRFGKITGSIATLTHLVASIGWVGGMLVAFGLLFETLTGTPMVIGIVGGAFVVVIYTMLGGLWAVAMTDSIQIVIILVGLVILLVVVLVDVGGWSTIRPQFPENALRMLPLENTGELWLNYIRMWLIFGLADIGSQSLLGRAMAAKSERAAQNSFYTAAFGYLAFGLIPVTLGIIASVTMPNLASSEAVIPTLAVEHLHPVAVAVFVGAILAAVMSTCDSALHGAASLISRNVLPWVYKNPSDHLTFNVARFAIPVIAFLAIFIAVKAQDIYDLLIAGNAPALAVTTIPVLLSVWWGGANRYGAWAAMAAGFITWVAFFFISPELPNDLLGLFASLIVIVIVSLATRKIDPPRPARDIDGNVVAFKDRLGILR
ncbi:MAG: sodium:solute symporter family protein [Pseudomonadota bacterium]